MPSFWRCAVAMLIEPTEDPDLGLQDSIWHVDGVGRHTWIKRRADLLTHQLTNPLIIESTMYIKMAR